METLLQALDAVSKLSIIVAVAAYLLQRQSVGLQHERARREKATAAILEFTKTLTPRSRAARKLAQFLDAHQINCLDEGREFAVRKEHRDLLLAALPDHITADQLAGEGEARLTQNQSHLLRWEIISYLNSIEVAAQCWFTGVAHEETIEHELRFLLDAEPGRNILTTFRKIAEAVNYPAMTALIGELELQRPKVSPPSPMKAPRAL